MTTREQFREMMKQRPASTEKTPILGVYEEEEKEERNDQGDQQPTEEKTDG
jgi:hypothetical protein